jgi:hypothetical protein
VGLPWPLWSGESRSSLTKPRLPTRKPVGDGGTAMEKILDGLKIIVIVSIVLVLGTIIFVSIKLDEMIAKDKKRKKARA